MTRNGKLIILLTVYWATLLMGFVISLSDGALVERMISADAQYAKTQDEHDKIIRVASATRLGIESSPSLIYIMAIKFSLKGAATIFLIFISTTVIFLFYSDMTGTLSEYLGAFIMPIWILSIANLFNTLFKILLCRIFGSISLGMIFRPFDWNDIWQVLALKTDIFFIAYVISVGIGCATIAKIRKSEGIVMVVCVWIALYFVSMILGIEPILSM